MKCDYCCERTDGHMYCQRCFDEVGGARIAELEGRLADYDRLNSVMEESQKHIREYMEVLVPRLEAEIQSLKSELEAEKKRLPEWMQEIEKARKVDAKEFENRCIRHNVKLWQYDRHCFCGNHEKWK